MQGNRSSTSISSGQPRKPRDFWADPQHQCGFIVSAEQKLQINSKDDWYLITKTQLLTCGVPGAASVLKKHSNSVAALVMSIYPDHAWLPWRFHQVPKGYWNALDHRKRFFDWAGAQLGCDTQMHRWYSVQLKDIRKLGGTRPLAIFYQFSHIRALQALYPQHEWLPWKFVANSRSFFATRENRAIFLRWAGKQLGVCDWTDWYRISTTQVDDLGGESMMNTYYSGSLINALRDCFPEHSWHIPGYVATKETRIQPS